MSLNTYPNNPFPPSTEQMHRGDNEELQAQIDAIKNSATIDSFGDVETALATKTDNDVIAPEFDAEAGVYSVGDLVMHEGKLYEFTTAHETAGVWNPEEVTEKTVADEVDTLKSGLTNIAKGYYTSYNDHTKWYHIGNITIPEIKWVRHMSIISVNGSVIRNLMFRSVLTDDVGFDNNETKIIEVYSSTTSTAIVGLIISNDKKSVDVYIKGGNFGNRTYSVLSDGGEGTINYFNPVETDLTDADMAVTG